MSKSYGQGNRKKYWYAYRKELLGKIHACEKRYVVFTGSSVLSGQLEEIEQQLTEKSLPFLFETVIKKIGDKYWSFT